MFGEANSLPFLKLEFIRKCLDNVAVLLFHMGFATSKTHKTSFSGDKKCNCAYLAIIWPPV
jgi:hypothetical protein